MTLRLMISGRHYNAADGLPVEIDLPESSRVADAVRMVQSLLPDSVKLPSTCLVAVSGKHVGTVLHHTDMNLSDRDEIVFVVPVAGG